MLVKKKDGSLHLCVDYRRLNSVSQFDGYPMPRVDDLIDQIGQAKFISTLDLTRGYWQVSVAEEARHKTPFITPFGLFQFIVMPFVLSWAPATFQRMMDHLLRGSEEYPYTHKRVLSLVQEILNCEDIETIVSNAWLVRKILYKASIFIFTNSNTIIISKSNGN